MTADIHNTRFAEITSLSSRTKSKFPKAPSASTTPRSDNLSTMHMPNNHKSIKIPAVHTNKEQGDDDYIKRKIQQEYNRSSRSLLRSQSSGSPGQSRPRVRKSRSLSNTRQADSQKNDQSLSRSRSRRVKKSHAHSEQNLSRSRSRKTNREQHPESPSSGSVSSSSSSESNSSSSDQAKYRSRKCRSLSSSRSALPRNSPTHSKRRLEYESQRSLTDTNRSSSSNSSSSCQPHRSTLRRLASIHTSTPSNHSATASVRSKCKSRSTNSKHSSHSCNRSHQGGSLSNHTLKRLSSIHSSTPSVQSNISNRSKTSTNSNHTNYDGSKRVSWKSDPKISFSDWTLHVVYRDMNNKRCIDVYHLHRNVVAYGNRKSNFLLRDIMDIELSSVFDNNNQTELEIRSLLGSGKKSGRSKQNDGMSKNSSWVKLPNESQAAVVPMVLDFMYYTNETNQRMSADRSCNVFKIAEGLKVRALQTAIGEFYEHNLSPKNMEEFLKAATYAKADMLLAICKAKIRQMIAVKPELSETIPVEFLPNILDKSGHSTYPDKSNRSNSRDRSHQKASFRLREKNNPADDDSDEYAQ